MGLEADELLPLREPPSAEHEREPLADGRIDARLRRAWDRVNGR
jgi:hypothetical protein